MTADMGLVVTRRQAEVADLLSRGLTNREIATRLFLSERTVEGHVLNLMTRLGATTRTQVAGWWIRHQTSERRPSVDEGAHRTNLPPPLTTFIGRDDDLASVDSLLARNRLVTLIGPGGCGKTQLALHVATGHLENQPDGVWLVELDRIADSALVAQAVADALGLRIPQGADTEAALVGYLEEKCLLIILDNAEHVVGAAARIAQRTLTRCRAVRLLATSRERLGVPGEMRYRVPSLAFPDPEDHVHSMHGESALAYGAVALFAERVREHSPHVVLDERALATVCRICAALDGLPLAIELAAAWAEMMSLDQILTGLADRFHFLVLGATTAPERHQTMAATVDWSYRLLDGAGRLLFRRLGVFAADFELSDVAAVCFDDDSEATTLFAAVSALVTKSLVAMTDGRLRCLETVREYCRLRLIEDRELEDMAARHARHFAQLTQDCWRTPGWAAALDQRLPDIRAAFAWGLRHEPSLALAMAAPMREHLLLRGHAAEARKAMDDLVDAVSDPPASRVHALTQAAAAAYAQNDVDSGLAKAAEAMSLAERCPRSALASVLQIRGYLAMAVGDLDSAVSDLRQAVSLAEEFRLPAAERAAALHHLGIAEGMSGCLPVAGSRLEESLALQTASGPGDDGHVTMAFLALIKLATGDPHSARSLLHEALEAAARLRDFRAAWSIQIAACVESARGDAWRALILAGAGSAIHTMAGTTPLAAWNGVLEPWLGAARERLTREQATSLAEQGQRLSFDEAIALALDDSVALRAHPSPARRSPA